jgi:hypothetical protein
MPVGGPPNRAVDVHIPSLVSRGISGTGITVLRPEERVIRSLTPLRCSSTFRDSTV